MSGLDSEEVGQLSGAVRVGGQTWVATVVRGGRERVEIAVVADGRLQIRAVLPLGEGGARGVQLVRTRAEKPVPDNEASTETDVAVHGGSDAVFSAGDENVD